MMWRPLVSNGFANARAMQRAVVSSARRDANSSAGRSVVASTRQAFAPLVLILGLAIGGCSVPLNLKTRLFGVDPEQVKEAPEAVDKLRKEQPKEPNTDLTKEGAAYSRRKAGSPIYDDLPPSSAGPGELPPEEVINHPPQPMGVAELRINGETIPASEILARDLPDLRQRSEDMSLRSYQDYAMQLAVVRTRDRIAESLLYQQASLRIPKDADAQIEKAVDREIRRIVTEDFEGIQRRYEKFLEERHQTIEDARKAIRRQLVITRHLEMIVKPRVASPTRAELLELYEENKDRWETSERRQMSLIDVRINDDRDAQAARARATEALSRLEAGEAFEDVAAEYSDGVFAAEGGSWGWVSREGVRDRLVPAVDTLYALAASEVSGLVQGPDAFFIVRCDEVDPGQEADFITAQADLKQEHFKREYNRMIAAEIERLEAKAEIDPPDLREFLLAVLDTVPLPGSVDESAG
jgi:hypothetical protein